MNPEAVPVDPRTTGKPTAQDTFSLLEYLLSHSTIRQSREAKPVVFEMLPEGLAWKFDPRAKGRLFTELKAAEEPLECDTLRIRCAPELLARLVTEESFELSENDEVSFEGEPDDLLPLARACEDGCHVLNIGPADGVP